MYKDQTQNYDPEIHFGPRALRVQSPVS